MEILQLYTILLATIQAAFCLVKLEIKFVRYVNHGGTGLNGHCCDGKGIFCFSACDHRFTICLDKAPSTSDINKCAYGIRKSSEISNSDSITFYGTIGNLQNPLVFSIDVWPEKMTLKVDVFDVDDNEDDKVDFLMKEFKVKLSRNKTVSPEESFRLSTARTLLDYKARAYCDVDYYGDNCDVSCKAQDDVNGHFTCDKSTGQKICMPGWKGELCDDDSVNECEMTPPPCNETQVCIDTKESYVCTCPRNFTGPYCNETEPPECPDDMCLNNGTCIIVEGNITCSCPESWTGGFCETKIDPCDDDPCQRNGTCINDEIETSGFRCQCPQYTSGYLCQNISVCVDGKNPCVQGICQEDESSRNYYKCVCSEGYQGINCDIEIDNITDQVVTTEPSSVNTTDVPQRLNTTTESMNISIKNISENESTTVKSKVPSTTVRSTTSTKSPDNRATVYLRGKIDANNKAELGKALVDLIHKMTNIDGQIYLDIKVDTYRTEEGEIISEIKAKGIVDGEPLDPEIIQKIFDSPDSNVDNYLPLPRYYTGRGGNGHVHRLTTKEEVEHDSWIHHYWYVVLIGVLAVVAAVIFVTGLVIHKRKKTVGPGQKDAGTVPSSTQNVTEATTAQSFENSLYFEMNQPKKNNSLR